MLDRTSTCLVCIATLTNPDVFSLYRNPDLDDRIYDCLITAMAAVQAADARASFLFVGDLNCNHQEWLSSTTTNSHGVGCGPRFYHCVRL